MDKSIICVENAAVKFKNFSIKASKMEIPEGYFIGIRGDNGAGKTTFINMLLGKYPDMRGQILIDGLDVIKDSDDALKQIGFISGERRFFMDEDARENERIYSSFYPDWNSEEYHRMLKKLKISTVTPLGSLSTGEMIKYQLAFSAAYNPRVLLLDEPTANLDSVFRDDFLKTLQEFVADYGTTILMATHLQEDLSQIADYIIEICDGKYSIHEVEL